MADVDRRVIRLVAEAAGVFDQFELLGDAQEHVERSVIGESRTVGIGPGGEGSTDRPRSGLQWINEDRVRFAKRLLHPMFALLGPRSDTIVRYDEDAFATAPIAEMNIAVEGKAVFDGRAGLPGESRRKPGAVSVECAEETFDDVRRVKVIDFGFRFGGEGVTTVEPVPAGLHHAEGVAKGVFSAVVGCIISQSIARELAQKAGGACRDVGGEVGDPGRELRRGGVDRFFVPGEAAREPGAGFSEDAIFNRNPRAFRIEQRIAAHGGGDAVGVMGGLLLPCIGQPPGAEAGVGGRADGEKLISARARMVQMAGIGRSSCEYGEAAQVE